jgi:hypothetical protein
VRGRPWRDGGYHIGTKRSGLAKLIQVGKIGFLLKTRADANDPAAMDRLWMLATGIGAVAIVSLFASAPRHDSSGDRPSPAAFNPALLLLEARVLNEAQLVGGIGIPHQYIELTFGDSDLIILRARIDFWTNSSVSCQVTNGTRAYKRAYRGLTLGNVLALVELEQNRAVHTPYHVVHNNCRASCERFMNALGAAETTAVTPSSASSNSYQPVPVAADARLERLDVFTSHLLSHATPAVVAAAVSLATGAGRADGECSAGGFFVPSSLSP